MVSNSNTGAVCSSSHEPIVVARTWSVRDPDAPAVAAVGGFEGSASERFSPGDHPDPLWMVPESIDGVPVLRQRPEEAGYLPGWVSA